MSCAILTTGLQAVDEVCGGATCVGGRLLHENNKHPLGWTTCSPGGQVMAPQGCASSGADKQTQALL